MALFFAVTLPAQNLPQHLTAAEPRVQEAVRAVQRAVAGNPDSADAWGRWGMVLDAHGYAEEAKDAYRRARELGPDDFRWTYYLATLVDLDDPLDAVGPYEEALAIDPDYSPAHVRLGGALEALGRPTEARRHYERAVSLEPDNHVAVFGLGRLALQGEDLAAAVEDLERAHRLVPDSQAITSTLARALYRQGDRERAGALAAAARDQTPYLHQRDARRAAVNALAVDTQSYLERSLVLRQTSQTEAAARQLEALLELAPDNAEALGALADLHDSGNEPRAALDAARRLLALDADDADAGAIVVRSLMKLGRHDEASAAVRELLSRAPGDAETHLLAAVLAAQSGDSAGLVRHLDRAQDIGSRDPAAIETMLRLERELARSYAAIGRREEALRRAELALALARRSGRGSEEVSRYEALVASLQAR